VIKSQVYVHDDDGGSGRAVAATAMLLLLQSGSWPAIQEHFTAAELTSLSPRQSQTVVQLRQPCALLAGLYQVSLLRCQDRPKVNV
jgi:hypothetical protein